MKRNFTTRKGNTGFIHGKKPRHSKKVGKNKKNHAAEQESDIVLDLIMEHQVPYIFDDAVLNQAEALPETVSAKDRRGRRDLRELFTVTIDGADAKDLDDAVSLEILETGNYRLGVHIADVTHYVKENSPLDREALNRGTSVYLADRVLPMLPPKLSNGICSLNEKVDRLTLSCFMEIDEKGNTLHHEITKSVIRVDHRMTYEIVNELLTCNASPYKPQYQDCMTLFSDLERLRCILWKKRMKRGALDFDLAETKVILDEHGKVAEIRPEERNLATRIIEEAMLVCNETVAEEYFKSQLPFVFRSHEEPEADKISRLSDFVRCFGLRLNRKGSSKAIQKLLNELADAAAAPIIERAVLQSMTKAHYTPKNLGHYGLAAEYYCHFTSPIRRYPDLQIHRIIKESLEKPIRAERNKYLSRIMPEVCRHSSLAERRAVELERAVESVKKAEYMAGRIGQEFEAVISGVSSWGFYVELSNTITGLVAVRTIKGDFYELDQGRTCFVGLRHKRVFRLGDIITVRLVKSDIKSGNLDFAVV